jgi:hypothetical protein
MGPHNRSGGRLQKLRADAKDLAGTEQCAGQHHIHVAFACDGLQVWRSRLKPRSGDGGP